MDSLKQTVYEVVSGYATEGLNSVSYLTRSEDGNVFAVTDFARVQGKHISGSV